MVNAVRLIIGGVVNLEMWAMLLLNIFVFSCIVGSSLKGRKDNAVYVLSGFNIACDICQLTLHVLYIGPSILTGSWFFNGQDSLGVTVAATWFLGFWFLGSLIQILFATNRFAVICFPTRTFFTHRRVTILFVLCFMAALGLVTYSQLISPCCRLTPDPRFFGYSYLIVPNQTSNPSSKYVELPLDILTSSYCGLSYIALFAYIIKMGARQDRFKGRELRCCVQFLIMFLTFTLTWLTFFLYPAIGIEAPEAYVVTTVVFMINCGINSIIYLALNKEIRSAANARLGRTVFRDTPTLLGKTTATARIQPQSTNSKIEARTVRPI